MFTKSVSLVANTSIFARSCAAGRQVLLYSMTMAADADLAMILPLPVEPGIGELDARFIDMSSYSEFFDDLAKAATIGHSNCRSPTRPERTSGEPTLLVRDVGSFEASFAPTRADLDRLDPRFRLQPKVWRKLPGYKDFGFAVFRAFGRNRN